MKPDFEKLSAGWSVTQCQRRIMTHVDHPGFEYYTGTGDVIIAKDSTPEKAHAFHVAAFEELMSLPEVIDHAEVEKLKDDVGAPA